MKPLFIALSLLLMFGNVHADKLSTDQMSLTSQADETTSDQSLFNDDDTYFNQVGEMFNQGTLPTVEETLGWWSGRCYRPNSPNRPSGGLLVFRADDNDSGPAFPPSYQMFGFTYNNGPAYYYDTLSHFMIESDVRETFARYHARGFHITAREKNGSWLTRVTETKSYASGSWFTRTITETKSYAVELRKYQDYFVTRIFSSENDEPTIIDYCYYFKKVYSY